MIQAKCNSCGKNWKVPKADKTYGCKDCGGEVRSGEKCPACDKWSPLGSAFCEHCGYGLESAPSTPKAAQAVTSASRSQQSDDDIERRMANKELGHLKKTIRAVRIFLITAAAFSGVFMGISILALLLIPEPETIVLFGFVTAVFLVDVIAAVRVTREPFFWTLAAASMRTLSVLASFIGGGPNALSIIVCVVLWIAVSRAARAQQIIAKHPEFSLDNRYGGRGLHTSEVGKARLKRQSKTKKKEAIVLGAAVVGVATIAILLALLITAPPSLDEPTEKFETAWKTKDRVAIGNLFEPSRRDRRSRSLERTLRRRGWFRTPPALDEPEVTRVREDDPSVLEARYKIGDGELVTTWVLSKETWYLRRVETEGFAIRGGPDAAIASFKESFAKADEEALLGLYVEEKKGTAVRFLKKIFNRPGWRQNPPQITGQRMREIEPGRVEVIFETTSVPIKSVFEYRSPLWRISKMSSPKVR